MFTVSQYATHWLDRLRGRVREQTRLKYGWTLTHYVLPQLGAVPLARLTRMDVRECLAAVITRGLSPASARAAQATLSAMLNEAVEDGLVPVNVAQRLGRAYRRRVRAVTVYDAAQLELFLNTARTVTPDLAPLFRACGHAGLRVGEAIGLQGGDVDLAHHRVLVQRTVRYGARIGPPKDGTPRLVDCTRSLIRALTPHVESAHPWLFAGKIEGQPVGYTVVNRLSRAIAEAAHLPVITPHALRRSYAATMVQRGLPLSYVARQLGHADVRVTQQSYTVGLVWERPGVLDEL